MEPVYGQTTNAQKAAIAIKHGATDLANSINNSTAQKVADAINDGAEAAAEAIDNGVHNVNNTAATMAKDVAEATK
ncbi:hypothetical protein SARC_07673 [Sphaeroforma arctica JP610]|uniref:Uncharacterized protein n=1 Tax=Sphaeroforma arctica JP610 TaxID=667725 RepID=A0A0L0FT14_9EUKA|nr:hypothetical protein SARC_07673 [Sphaeroforma arctica JP610]KNC79957.1 hypothetical protein SARC_07673 [Sphaeroforma arctica JP610]|eukprot:XP_014153859.1 hypothetical protein SARC_07673 [Sphaeroforma arctica JP610]